MHLKIHSSYIHLCLQKHPILILNSQLLFMSQYSVTLILYLEFMIRVQIPEMSKKLFYVFQFVEGTFVIFPAPNNEVDFPAQHFVDQLIKLLCKVIIVVFRLSLEIYLHQLYLFLLNREIWLAFYFLFSILLIYISLIFRRIQWIVNISVCQSENFSSFHILFVQQFLIIQELFILLLVIQFLFHNFTQI